MRQSKIFSKTQKNSPSDEVSKNAQLLIRAGFINKEMAGVYDLLPLGMRVVEKIKNIVREELGKIDGQEILMSSMQNKNIWSKTKRWEDDVVDVWFKSELKSGGQVGFGWSHEEPIVEMMQNHISSYKELPAYVYQFQNKLRNELRAKSGILRGREFLMKDMYSFCDSKESLEKFYQETIDAYFRIYKKLGLGEDTFMTFASGGAFTEFSHEFQTICDAGEDMIYINREKNIAINEEILNDQTLKNLNIKKKDLEKVKTAEVGNIFNFGKEKCQDMELFFTDKEGEKKPVFLGSYGIGITRVMGVIVEKFSDEKGIIWTENVAPFKFHFINIGKEKETEKIYEKMLENKMDVLWDDRDKRPGEKFSDSDLIGIPYRIVLSEKSLEQGGVELKKRGEEESKIISIEKLFEIL